MTVATTKRENEGPSTPAAEKKARSVAAASGAANDKPPAAASGAVANKATQPAAQPETTSKFDRLMISSQAPFRPKAPSPEEIASGRGGSVRTYVENLQRYIVWKFSMFLHDDEVVQLRHPLYASRCPRIEEEGPAASGAKKKPADAAAWRPTSIMEPMDVEHCIAALNESQFYEGAISIWNVNPLLTSAFGVDFDVRDPSWAQFQVLAGHWSSANLASSHSDEAAQRYFFPGMVQSFVKDVGHIEEKRAKMQTLRDMPACGGHAVCWSFYAAIDEALEAGDTRRLRLLWEVSNQVRIRLRLNPSKHQIVLDRLALSDELRVTTLGGGAQTFFDMCCDVFTLPSIAGDLKISCPKLVSCLKDYGIQYKGKVVDKPMGHAMLSCMVFALDAKSMKAVRLLERIDPKAFDDHTKVMRCCQRIKSSASGGEHIEMLLAGGAFN